MKAPALSDRTHRIEPFHTMELMKRAVALQQAGHPVIHMSISKPDQAPEPVVAALETAVRAGHTEYTSAMGIEPLRRAIAADYGHRYGLDIDPARIVVTAGANAALSLALRTGQPGDQVLLTDPAIRATATSSAPSTANRSAFGGPETRFQMTPELLQAHWAPSVRGTLLASPANPTGTSIPFEHLSRIVEYVRAQDGFTIVDEIYLGLSYDGKARSALELGDDLIVTNSFSSTFMTGWRLGWLVVPPALVRAFESCPQNLYICASTLAQHAALACFTPPALAIFEERRDEIPPAPRLHRAGAAVGGTGRARRS
ncbi:MAG: aminotransferase class I/II-fold pyridoxal phosphate-dependent enzyme [Burkholderiaceae bacterium]|nr:aminotransferase class I/II-fold pyridoxal phosphate-dependent enzyme [Burkholderiaceae bacterium]